MSASKADVSGTMSSDQDDGVFQSPLRLEVQEFLIIGAHRCRVVTSGELYAERKYLSMSAGQRRGFQEAASSASSASSQASSAAADSRAMAARRVLAAVTSAVRPGA